MVAPDALLLLTIGMMGVAVLLPFMQSPLFWGDALVPDRLPLPIVTWSLIGNSHAETPLVILAILVVVAVSRLAGSRNRMTPAVCAAASVAVVPFALSTVADNGHGFLPSWFYAYGNQHLASLGVGFYLYVSAAVVGIVASLLIAIAGLEAADARPEALRPLPS